MLCFSALLLLLLRLLLLLLHVAGRHAAGRCRSCHLAHSCTPCGWPMSWPLSVQASMPPAMSRREGVVHAAHLGRVPTDGYRWERLQHRHFHSLVVRRYCVRCCTHGGLLLQGLVELSHLVDCGLEV
jgi:hypothetical protein